MLAPVRPRSQAAHALLASLFVMVSCLTASSAAEYPTQPIRLIHGFAPGGPADSISRVIAEPLGKLLGQPVVVEAKPGMGGNLGADAVAKSAPDGYTLGLVTGGHAVSAALYKKLPFDPLDSFQMITTVVEYSFIVAVRPDFEAKTMRQLIALAAANPGKLNYGSAGVGTTQHLAAELLKSNAALDIVHIPYRGDAAAIAALLGKQVDFIVASAAAVAPQIEAGTVKALAVSASSRWKGLPDVPTVAESGVAGFDVRTWTGIVAPKGLPNDVLKRLHADISTVVNTPEIKQKLEQLVAGEVHTRTPDEMKAMVAGEIARWKKLVIEANIPRH